ncbi:hypothetical protein ABK040_000682 [Willaertia magna]
MTELNEVVLLGTSLGWVSTITGIETDVIEKIYVKNCRFIFINESDSSKSYISCLVEADLANVDGNYLVKRKIGNQELGGAIKKLIKTYKKANKKIISVEIVGNFKQWKATWVNSLILSPLNQKKEETTIVNKVNQKRWLLREVNNNSLIAEDNTKFDKKFTKPQIQSIASSTFTNPSIFDKYKWEKIVFNFNLGEILNDLFDRRGQYNVLKNRALFIRNLFTRHVIDIFENRTKDFFSNFKNYLIYKNKLVLELQNYCGKVFNQNAITIVLGKYFGKLTSLVADHIVVEWNDFIEKLKNTSSSSINERKSETEFEVKQLLAGENLNNFKPKKVNSYFEAFCSELKRTKKLDFTVEKLKEYIVKACQDEKIAELVLTIYPDEFINNYKSRILEKDEDIGLLEVLILSEIFCVNVSFLSNDLSKYTKIKSIIKEEENIFMSDVSNDIYSLEELKNEEEKHTEIKEDQFQSNKFEYYIKLNNCKPIVKIFDETTTFTDILCELEIFPGAIELHYPLRINNKPIIQEIESDSNILDSEIHHIKEKIESDSSILEKIKNNGLSFFWITKNSFTIYFALNTKKEYIYNVSLSLKKENSLKKILNRLQPAPHLNKVKIITQNNHFENYNSLCSFLSSVNHVEELYIESNWEIGFELPKKTKIKVLTLKGFQLGNEGLLEIENCNLEKLCVNSEVLIPTSINDNSINGNNNEIIVNNNEMFTITNEQINKFQKDQCNVMCHIYLPPIQPLQKKITLQNSLQLDTLQNTLQQKDSINNELTIIDLSEINKWHNNFIPNIEDIKTETDLQQWINTNLEEWNNFCNFPQDNINLDYLKIKMNKLGFTINGNLHINHHIPIWLRVYKRIHPLQQTLQKLCQVDDINTTILYITIDGNENLKEIINLLITIKCVKIKVYFHTYFYNSSDKLFNLEKKGYSIARKLNTHYIFGMYLILHIWKYNYIITLEDDLEPTPDFYRYHFSLYQFIYNNHLNKESNLKNKIVGREVDLLAPGEKILTTSSSYSGKSSEKKLISRNGTSFACPFVAGVCAIIMSRYEKLYPNKPKLDQQTIKKILRKMCDSNGFHTQDRGYGILNIEQLLEKNFFKNIDSENSKTKKKTLNKNHL